MRDFISKRLDVSLEKIDWNHNFLCINRETGEELEYLSFFGAEFSETPTYKVIRYHHDPPRVSSEELVSEFKEKNKEYIVFLVRVADRMASSVSRSLKRKYPVVFENNAVSKLWSPHTERIELISSENDFKNLIKFTNNFQNKEQFFQKFRKELLKRPEEFKPPKNITSLFTHSRLVGKLYRFFEANTKEVSVGIISFKGSSANSLKYAMNNWNIKIVNGELNFHIILLGSKT